LGDGMLKSLQLYEKGPDIGRLVAREFYRRARGYASGTC
jgi:hypothetical protein